MSMLRTQNLQIMRITQIIGTMSLFHLEEYNLVKRNKCIVIVKIKKIHQCEVFFYDVLLEWMQVTRHMHNSVVLLAILGLVMSMLKTQNLQNQTFLKRHQIMSLLTLIEINIRRQSFSSKLKMEMFILFVKKRTAGKSRNKDNAD